PVVLETAHSIFAVPDMHCAGCIAKVERGLAMLPGIHAARVNYSARRVAITHDPALTVPDLRAAIAGIGFAAEPLADPTIEVESAQDKR
ncbi:heavy-metal-associated domain-containing protein, partial [Bacillus velezensis]|uniref:heavy-metal-associated domain-containing protein n=1 Tax=Bacillus velezensis TaxID=492670 RepID=UPI003CFB6387